MSSHLAGYLRNGDFHASFVAANESAVARFVT
jgi:hypothetical protein